MNKQNLIYRIANYSPWPGVFSLLEIFVFIAGILVTIFLFQFTLILNNLYESIYVIRLDSLQMNLAVKHAYSSLNERLAGNMQIDFDKDILSQIGYAEALCTEMEIKSAVIYSLPVQSGKDMNLLQMAPLCHQLPLLKGLAATRWMHYIENKPDGAQIAYKEAFANFFDSTQKVVDFSEPEIKDTRERIRRINLILSFIVGSILITLSLILWRNRKLQQNQVKQIEMEIEQRFHLSAALNTEQNKISTLLMNWPDPIFVLDVQSNIMDANPAAAHLMGFSKPEFLLGKNEADLQSPELTNEALEENQAILKTGKPLINKQVTLLNKTTGKWQQLLVTKVGLYDQERQVIGLAAIAQNITTQKQAEDALRSANQKLSQGIAELEQRTQELDLLTQMIGLLSACQNMEEAYKIIEDQLGRFSLADSGMLYMIKPSRNNLRQIAAWGQSVSDCLVFPPSDCWGLRLGRLHTVEFNHSARHDNHPANPLICLHISPSAPAEYLCLPLVAQGESLGILHLRHLINTEAAGSEEIPESWFTPQRVRRINIIAESLALAIANLMLRATLRQQSIRDPLTGLFNRRYLEETLERELLRASRSKKTVGLMMIDIDHFKQFNDTHGHPAADVVLSAVAQLFSSTVRREDLVCRYGGEEFVIMLPEADLETVCQRAEVIRKEVAELNVQYQGQVLQQVSISIGVGVFPTNGDIPGTLIRNVDQALYRAKNNGRNRVEVVTPVSQINMALL